MVCRQTNFQLGGVFCGSHSAHNFKLINKTHTKSRVEFDLTRHTDFTLEFPGSQTAGACCRYVITNRCRYTLSQTDDGR